MKVAIGCDHGGYPLKDMVLKWLFSHNIDVVDKGIDGAQESVDYPPYALAVALEVQRGYVDMGILLCGTGLGMSITANKVPGIRCAVVTDAYSARMARTHNDANVLSIGARVIGSGVVEDILDVFINTKFSDEPRHQKRIDLIKEIEKDIMKQYAAQEGGTQEFKPADAAAKPADSAKS